MRCSIQGDPSIESVIVHTFFFYDKPPQVLKKYLAQSRHVQFQTAWDKDENVNSQTLYYAKVPNVVTAAAAKVAKI